MATQETQYIDRYERLLEQQDALKEDTKNLNEEIKDAGIDVHRIKVAASWRRKDETERSKILAKEEEVTEARSLADQR